MRATQKMTGTAALVAVLLLAGCGSSGLGDILGGGDTSSSLSAVQGTVERVDVSGRYIVLSNVNNRSYLNNGGGSTVSVYFDNNTVVEYQGQSYRPEDLERGDRIEARVDENSNNRLYTDRIAVLSDISSGGSTAGGYYGADFTGTVSYVDSRNRVIEVNRGSSASRSDIVSVVYDSNTVVNYQGRSYRPEDLERGDVVELQVSSLSGGRYRAEEIRVVRSVSDAGYGSGTSANVVRGAVRYVNTGNRTIELEQASWRSGFAPGDGGYGSGGVVVVRYETNTPVEYQGRTYAVQNLERGDVVDVRVANAGSTTPVADRIVLVSDARAY